MLLKYLLLSLYDYNKAMDIGTDMLQISVH